MKPWDKQGVWILLRWVAEQSKTATYFISKVTCLDYCLSLVLAILLFFYHAYSVH
jgi:hypothetical protein